MSRFDTFWVEAKTLTLSAERKDSRRAAIQAYSKEQTVRNEAESCLGGAMENKLDPMWSSAKAPILATDRKDAIRERVRAYTKKETEHHGFSWIVWQWKMMTASVAALFSISSMGLCYAAESTVPGDALYGVKIHVNEPLFGAFSFSEEARAKWQVRLTERRIQEEQLLFARGTLTGTLLEQVHTNIQTRAEFTAERLQEFAETHPEAAEELQNRLFTIISTRAAIREKLESGAPILPLIRNLNTSSADSTNDTVRPIILPSTPLIQRIMNRRQRFGNE